MPLDTTEVVVYHLRVFCYNCTHYFLGNFSPTWGKAVDNYVMKSAENKKSDGPRCLLITGMPHSGTRLLTEMLARHPEVSVPTAILNRVGEYTPLHQFFIRSMDATPLEAARYVINFGELKSILEDYVTHVDQNKKFFVLKLPYYPLNCLEFFVDFLKGQITLIYLERPKEKIINSFIQKGEDQTLFLADPDEFVRQLKKFDVSYHRDHLHTRDVKKLLSDLVGHVESKVNAWDSAHPDLRFLKINIERFATDRAHLSKALIEMGISPDAIDQMLQGVQKNRLLVKFTGKIRKFIPSPVIVFLKKLESLNKDE